MTKLTKWYRGGEANEMCRSKGWVMAKKPGCVPFAIFARALVEARQDGRREALEEAATHARCAFDDRPRSRDNIDWTDGFDDGTRAAEAAIRNLKDTP